MPRIGTRKLQYLLAGKLEPHGIEIGRDKLFDLLEEHDLLVRRRKRRKAITTDSDHPYRRYPNLIKELQVLRPDELWVSDITYVRLRESFCYLSLVTDAYSRRIVGYCLYPTLQKEGPVTALQEAIKGRGTNVQPLMHHSDRGRQYCCDAYIAVLNENNIMISMTEKGDPYENALAERVNGILKGEFLLDHGFDSYAEALVVVNDAIAIYNGQRPHASCNYLTPDKAHEQAGPLPMRWKKKEKKEQVVIEIVH